MSPPALAADDELLPLRRPDRSSDFAYPTHLKTKVSSSPLQSSKSPQPLQKFTPLRQESENLRARRTEFLPSNCRGGLGNLSCKCIRGLLTRDVAGAGACRDRCKGTVPIFVSAKMGLSPLPRAVHGGPELPQNSVQTRCKPEPGQVVHRERHNARIRRSANKHTMQKHATTFLT